MEAGPIGRRFHSGSRVWPECSTSMSGISFVASAAPGPSFGFSWSLISHRLRDSVCPDETEMDIHEQNDQRRQQEDMCREENLQGGWPDHRAALEHRLDEGAERRRWR